MHLLASPCQIWVTGSGDKSFYKLVTSYLCYKVENDVIASNFVPGNLFLSLLLLEKSSYVTLDTKKKEFEHFWAFLVSLEGGRAYCLFSSSAKKVLTRNVPKSWLTNF